MKSMCCVLVFLFDSFLNAIDTARAAMERVRWEFVRKMCRTFRASRKKSYRIIQNHRILPLVTKTNDRQFVSCLVLGSIAV